MPEWVAELLKAVSVLLVGGGTGGYGVFKYLERRQRLRQIGDKENTQSEREAEAADFNRKQQTRSAEIQILYDTIERLEREIQDNKREFQEYKEKEDKDKSKLRSEHTACRLALAAVKQTREYLRKQNAQLGAEKAELNERLGKMEEEIELLKKGGS